MSTQPPPEFQPSQPGQPEVTPPEIRPPAPDIDVPAPGPDTTPDSQPGAPTA